LVGEITIFTLGFDQLRFVGLNLAFQFQ
jgi:hypothetical protein